MGCLDYEALLLLLLLLLRCFCLFGIDYIGLSMHIALVDFGFRKLGVLLLRVMLFCSCICLFDCFCFNAICFGYCLIVD